MQIAKIAADFFWLRAELSQDLLDKFSQCLHSMICIELQIINPIFFYDILRDLAMATNFVSKLYTPFICDTAIPKWKGILQRQCTC